MRFKSLLFNTVFFLNGLLIFLLLAENYLRVPPVLQVFGRIHPLFLHLPIGMLLLAAACELFFPFYKYEKGLHDLRDGLLLITAFAMVLTALMGLFLSIESGYEPEGLVWHKWAGSFCSLLLLVWYQYREQIRKNSIINKTIGLISIVIITLTGHFGGNITHGENFVLAPVTPQKEQVKVSLEEAVVFTHLVQPVFESKCISCHNETKAKGQLVMESAELLLKGGKNGILWDTTASQLGLLLQRVHLPLEDDLHMPPSGKPQLTDEEISMLTSWIKKGSNFELKVNELPKDDPLVVYATKMLKPDEEAYAFEPADEATIQSLNSFYRLVQPLADRSPALSVRFFGSAQFNPSQLKELEPLRQQIVQLDLSRMPIKDEDLSLIASFPNLRKLILNFTDIEGKTFKELLKLKNLRELSLSGTKIQASSLQTLTAHNSLKKVFIWNSGVDDKQAAALASKTGKDFDNGYKNDTSLLKLTPAIIEHEQTVFNKPEKLRLKHNVKGAVIRYTLDGSDPDSVNSPIYSDTVKIYNEALLKAKVYRDGWLSSDIVSGKFYFSKPGPEKVTLLTSPMAIYRAEKEKTLFDRMLGGNSNNNGRWLGYEWPSQFGVLLDFEKPFQANQLTLNGMVRIYNRIFPPSSITLWYGNDSLHLKKLSTIQPAAATGYSYKQPAAYRFTLPAESFRYLKIEAIPYKGKLPQWHELKDEFAMVMFDEIIIE